MNPRYALQNIGTLGERYYGNDAFNFYVILYDWRNVDDDLAGPVGARDGGRFDDRPTRKSLNYSNHPSPGGVRSAEFCR
jgi:hypothetical protein